MTKKTFIITATALLMTSLIWLVLTPILFGDVQAGTQVTAVHPGFQAPGFTLQTPQGQTLSLSNYEGQTVLVFLWASWCSVCKATMPGLQAVYADYTSQGFEILAVNMTSQDTASAATSYFESQNYTYPLLLDREGTVASDYQLHAVPTSVLVGPDGIVQEVVIGAGMTEGFLRAELDKTVSSSEGE